MSCSATAIFPTLSQCRRRTFSFILQRQCRPILLRTRHWWKLPQAPHTGQLPGTAVPAASKPTLAPRQVSHEQLCKQSSKLWQVFWSPGRHTLEAQLSPQRGLAPLWSAAAWPCCDPSLIQKAETAVARVPTCRAAAAAAIQVPSNPRLPEFFLSARAERPSEIPGNVTCGQSRPLRLP